MSEIRWFTGVRCHRVAWFGDTIRSHSHFRSKPSVCVPTLDARFVIFSTDSLIKKNRKNFEGDASSIDLTNRRLEVCEPAVTRRERDIVRLVAGGLSNRSVAHQLGLREGTVNDQPS